MPSEGARTARAVDSVQPQREALRDAHRAFGAACESREQSAVLAASFAELRSAFDAHVEYAEGRSGLFEELLDDEPTKAAPEVDRLRRDHIVIAAAMDRVGRLLGDGADLDDDRLAGASTELIRLLGQHRRRGAELLHQVYGVSIGAGD